MAIASLPKRNGSTHVKQELLDIDVYRKFSWYDP